MFKSVFPPLKREVIESWEELRARQASFFQSLNVDEYITRAGQEPVFVENGQFTYDIATMARFGIHDVTPWRDDYGSPEFCALGNKSSRKGRKLTCLIVTEEMLSYELARRQKGEECQADGTLRVRH